MGLSLNSSTIFGTLSILLVLVCSTNCSEERHETKVQHRLCGSLQTDGYTVPCGDILLREGDALNLTCNLYQDKLSKYGDKAVNRLYFTRNNSSIPREMVEIINDTSIRLYIKNLPTTENDNYFCQMEVPENSGENKTDILICMNVVIVGVPPQEVTDFSCIGRNYENMTCSWSLPNNYLKTDYNLSYTLKKRSQRKIRYGCEHFIMDNKKMACFWNISTSPPYRQVYSTFDFTLSMSNYFGNRTLNYTFEHFKRVVPNPPVDLRVEATSPHSAHLSWKIPKAMTIFPRGVYHRISYYCENENVWKDGGFITNAIKNESLEYDVTGLKYAHCKCSFRVGLLSSEADPNDPAMWSINASRIIQTKSKIPDSPPDTTLGSFEIVSKFNSDNDIYVYWKQIDEVEKNGQDFRYLLEFVADVSGKTLVVEETALMYTFKNLPNTDYTVKIWSKNSEGRSATHSTIKIPARRLPTPASFKVAQGDKQYELSWVPPISHMEFVTNYTIFMCTNHQVYKCKDNLDWVIVPRNQTKYNKTISVDAMYQFAIAANSLNGSSGMLWSECTISLDRSQQKLNNVWINSVGHDYIEVVWKLLCKDYGEINDYEICYCMIEKAQRNCSGANHTEIIKHGSSVDRGRITGLKPYTSYKLQVRVIISDGVYSPWSDDMYNTTSEAAPSPPNNIKVVRVTNSSISITWEPPTSENGILKYYKVYHNILGQEFKFNETAQSHYTFEGLRSYTKYNITVEACTVLCSKRSPDIYILTDMATPGEIEKPVTEFVNASVFLFVWKPPSDPRGKLDYYQIHLMQNLGSANDTNDIYNTSEVHYTLSCNSKKHSYVSVRAVNVINDTHYPGPWSTPLPIYCFQSSSLIYVIAGISLIFVVVLVFMGGKKSYDIILGLRIIPKLPQGLQHAVDHSLVMSEKKPEDKDRNAKADRESLLDPLSGNESGISSGHESITSSVESAGTLISGSDSGSEQPLSLTEDTTRKNSLRQRNVSSKAGYIAMPDPLVSTTISKGVKPTPTSGNYCMLGVAPAAQSEPETQYVPITETSTNLPYISDLPPPLPYVMTGDLIKTPNPGYIPFSAAEPAPKNTGYVVAGEIGKTSTGYIPFSAPETTPKNTGYVVAGLSKDFLAPLKED